MKSFNNKAQLKAQFSFTEKFVKVVIDETDQEGIVTEQYEFCVRKFSLGNRTEFAKFVGKHNKEKAQEAEGADDTEFAVDSLFTILVMGLSDDKGEQMFTSKEDLLKVMQDLSQDVASSLAFKIMEINSFTEDAGKEAVKN